MSAGPSRRRTRRLESTKLGKSMHIRGDLRVIGWRARGAASEIAFMAAGVVGGAARAEAPAGPGPATGQIEELVVTAERREVSLQKTAISATVLTGHDLDK